MSPGTLASVTTPVIEYSGTHKFGIPPDELWAQIGRTDRFVTWWGWLEEFRTDDRGVDRGVDNLDSRAGKTNGDGLQAGTVLRGVVAPPVPYRMRVEVEILRVSPPSEVEAAVHGDLEGRARLSVHPAGHRIDRRYPLEGRDDAATDEDRLPIRLPASQVGT